MLRHVETVVQASARRFGAVARIAGFSLLALGLVSAMPAWAASLSNGGLEAGTGSRIDGWTPYRWDGEGSIEVTREVAFEGQQSVVINGHGVAKQALLQEVALKPCSYRLTGATATYGVTVNHWRQGGAVHLAFGDRDMTHLLGSGDSDWRRFELVFEVTSAKPVTIYLFNYGGGRFFVDDLRLEAVAGCPKGETFTQSTTTAKPLGFVAPITDEDRVLAGYCTAAGFSERPLCRRLKQGGAQAKAVTGGVKPPRMIADFDEIDPFGPGSPVARTAIQGNRSGLVRAEQYIGAQTGGGLIRDWSGYDWLRFEVDNPTETAQPIGVEIWDDKTTGYWSRVNWYGYVAPGRSTLEVPLQAFVGEKSVVGERRRLDLKSIHRLAISGTKADLAVDQFRLESNPPIASLFPELIALDAGTATSPAMTGFTPFTSSTVYRPERGWGLIPGTAVARTEDRRHPDNLNRDWISFIGGGLQFDLPNGDYTVWLMMEDAGYWEYYPSWTQRSVLIQESEVLLERRSADEFFARYFRHADDEDLPGDPIWANYVKKRYAPKAFKAKVSNGSLTIRFKSNGHPYAATLAGLVLYPEAQGEAGRRFMAELEQRLESQFNAEYRQFIPPQPKGVGGVANVLGGKARLFRRAITRDIFANDRPAANELTDTLGVALASGHTEALTFALHAEQAQDLTEARLTIPGIEVTPYKVRHRATRMTEDGSIYMSQPRVVDPLEVSAEQPLRLKADGSRQFWFDLEVAPGTKPGRIAGQLTLRLASGETQVVPVSVEVYPWTLPSADIPIGYLGVAPRYPEASYPEIKSRRVAEMTAGIRLLADAGMTAASGGLDTLRVSQYHIGRPVIDFSQADIAMAAIRKRFGGEVLTYEGFGLENALMNGTPDQKSLHGKPLGQVVSDVLASIEMHGRERGWLPLRHVVGDEPAGEAIAQSIASAELLRQAYPRGRTAVFTSFRSASEPTAALAGKVDRIYLNHHSEAAIQHILSKGGECSLYNQTTRFTQGIYLFKLRKAGCRGHMRFAFSSVHADPWYDLDGREEEYVAAYIHRDGVLRPAIGFLRLRAAVDDYRFVVALEQAIAAAPPGPARAAAETWLTNAERRIKIGDDAPRPWSDDQLDGVRRELAQHLLALGFKGPDTSQFVPASKR